jgi:hypothetical protein
VVFNCEDKEAGKVINTVISDVKSLLENEIFDIGKKTKLEELLKDLTDLKDKLDTANRRIEIIKVKIKDKKSLIELMEKRGGSEDFERE